MVDLILGSVLALIVIAAGRYVYKVRKSGAKCIGCPAGGGCSGQCGCTRSESEP